MSRLRERARRAFAAIVEADPLDLAIRATLLLFLVGPNVLGVEWHYRLTFQAAAVAGLLVPAVGRSAAFWCAVAALSVIKTLDHWWIQDNHVFVLTWWCVALAIGLLSREPERVVTLNARVLVGLSFLIAVIWKGFLSPDYMSGDYFHYAFLTDARFAPLGELLCGMTSADYAHNADALRQLAGASPDVTRASLRGTVALRTLAVLVTWWTVLIEGALALLFLLPDTPRLRRLTRWRDAALLLFAWTTYAAVPVKTFGWTLATLGLAQCPREARATRLYYLLTYPLLLVYEIAPTWAALAWLGEVGVRG